MTSVGTLLAERCTAGGVRWCVRACGSGPPILMLHGAGASSSTFEPLVSALASRGVRGRFIAPDLPGLGESSALAHASPSPGAMARALVELIAHLDVGRLHAIVAHSAGALVAATMLKEGQMATRRFVALAPAIVPLPRGLESIARLAARLLARTSVLPREALALDLLLASFDAELPAAARARYRALLASPSHRAGTLAMLSAWDVRAATAGLGRFPQPTLVLTGARDRAVRPSAVTEAIGGWPSARHVVLGGVGHLLHEERPERVAELVAPYILDVHEPSTPRLRPQPVNVE